MRHCGMLLTHVSHVRAAMTAHRRPLSWATTPQRSFTETVVRALRSIFRRPRSAERDFPAVRCTCIVRHEQRQQCADS